MDMKTNIRVVFPPGRQAKEEVLIEVRTQMWEQKFRRFMEKNCKEDGSQKTPIDKISGERISKAN